MAIVYISHKLDEVFAVADRITVLRDGKRVATAPTAEWTDAALVAAMVGRDLSSLLPRGRADQGAIRLEERDLVRPGACLLFKLAVRSGVGVVYVVLLRAGRNAVDEA